MIFSLHGSYHQIKSKVSPIIHNNGFYKRFLRTKREARSVFEWKQRQYGPPSPDFIKRRCLIRNGIPNAVWVESGTYLGDTTQLLSNNATTVYSIEPEQALFAAAVKRFNNVKNVRIINGISEEIFPKLLPQLDGDINFWLDGHYSAGITFKGPNDTPIAHELNAISDNLDHLKAVGVFVDDVRCFNPRIPEFSTYPPSNFLVEWAKKNNFHWYIEHDIFIAKNY